MIDLSYIVNNHMIKGTLCFIDPISYSQISNHIEVIDGGLYKEKDVWFQSLSVVTLNGNLQICTHKELVNECVFVSNYDELKAILKVRRFNKKVEDVINDN